jgi:hypothetical protein
MLTLVAVTGVRFGVRIEGMLEEAGHQHARVVAEGFLGAVAVVDVEVDDGDPLQPVHVERVAGGDGDVVEQAEAHRLVRARMVAGRADRAEGVVDRAGDDVVGGGQRQAGGAQGGAVAVLAQQGVAVERIVFAGGRQVVAHQVERARLWLRRIAASSAGAPPRRSIRPSSRARISWSSMACRRAGDSGCQSPISCREQSGWL